MALDILSPPPTLTHSSLQAPSVKTRKIQALTTGSQCWMIIWTTRKSEIILTWRLMTSDSLLAI